MDNPLSSSSEQIVKTKRPPPMLGRLTHFPAHVGTHGEYRINHFGGTNNPRFCL